MLALKTLESIEGFLSGFEDDTDSGPGDFKGESNADIVAPLLADVRAAIAESATFTRNDVSRAARAMNNDSSHFAGNLGAALMHADSDNAARIVAAFPHLIRRYL